MCIHDLKTPNVLHNYQQVAIGHHQRRRQHGVTPPVPHHPQHARPDEEDKRQPADVCDAPRLKRTKRRKFLMNEITFYTTVWVSCLFLHMFAVHSKYLYTNGQRRMCCPKQSWISWIHSVQLFFFSIFFWDGYVMSIGTTLPIMLWVKPMCIVSTQS